MKHLIYLLVLLPTLNLAQVIPDINNNIIFDYLQTEIVKEKITKPTDPDLIDGTYLETEWKKGKIVFIDKTTSDQFEYLYNVPEDKIVLRDKKKTKILQLIDPKSLDSLVIDSKIYIYTMYGKQNDFGFFEKLSNGKLTLLKRYEASYRKEVPSDGIIEGKPAYYAINTHYYVQEEGKPAQLLRVNRKNILNLLSDEKSEVKSFIKQNKIKIRKEEHLVKIFIFYNSFPELDLTK